MIIYPWYYTLSNIILGDHAPSDIFKQNTTSNDPIFYISSSFDLFYEQLHKHPQVANIPLR